MVFLIQEMFQLCGTSLWLARYMLVSSTFNFSLEHHDHQEKDTKHVPMVNLKNPKKNTVHRQHTNQGKQNHTKWIESYISTIHELCNDVFWNHTKWIESESILATNTGPIASTRITQSGLKELIYEESEPERVVLSESHKVD